MPCETNLLKENNELNEQVKKLSNKLERCYNSKVTFEHMLKTQRYYGDKCGLGFKKKMTKGERKRERKMKKLQPRKLSHNKGRKTKSFVRGIVLAPWEPRRATLVERVIEQPSLVGRFLRCPTCGHGG